MDWTRKVNPVNSTVFSAAPTQWRAEPASACRSSKVLPKLRAAV